MNELEFAIEMGSSNTVIYKKGNGIVLSEPSIIAVDTSRRKHAVKAVGFMAQKMRGKVGQSTKILNPIEEGVVSHENYAALMLKEFMKKVAKTTFFNKKIRILFVIPVGISEKEKTQFRALGYSVGASKVEFVPSILASLIGCSVNINSPSGVLSLNLGGGTVNIGSVSLNSIINGYSISLGGIKMDEAIKRYVEEAYELQISDITAEKIKKETGSLFIHDTSNIEVSGIDVNTKSPRQDVVQGRNIRPAIEFFFTKIVSAIEDILNSSTPDIVSDISNNGIYVTGALANLTGLDNYLKLRLRLPINIPQNPEEATIIGAGKLLSDKKHLNIINAEN